MDHAGVGHDGVQLVAVLIVASDADTQAAVQCAQQQILAPSRQRRSAISHEQ